MCSFISYLNHCYWGGTARFSECPLFRRSVVPKVRCSEGSLLWRVVTPRLRFVVPKTRFNIPKMNEFNWKTMFFVVFNLRNSLMFLDLHKGQFYRGSSGLGSGGTTPVQIDQICGALSRLFWGTINNIDGTEQCRLFSGLRVGCINY